jgi:hypothetical protein
LVEETVGFPRAPFLIGFVLAVPLERFYFLRQVDGADVQLPVQPVEGRRFGSRESRADVA